MKVLDETKLTNLLEFIKDYQKENGKSPSYRVIMHKMNYNNLATVSKYVWRLQSNGLIQKDNLGGIAISKTLNLNHSIVAPLVGCVTCGNPILAVENIEGNYSLPTDIFGKGETFILHAKGNSMINAGIHNDDYLVVKKTNSADEGQIVVALIDEEATVKRLFKKGKKIILHPENPEFEDIVLDKVKILGIVKSYIHTF